MPGVLMCEAAAQLCSFFCGHIRLVKKGFVGFGGMEDVRFRGQVRPGDRLVLVSKATRLHRRQPWFDTQGFVGNNMVFHAKIIGVNITAAATPRPPYERHARFPTCHRRFPAPDRPGTAFLILGRPIDWANLFANSNPVELEIGSGKGPFLINAAKPGQA